MMFFKNKRKLAFERTLPTERLHKLFRDEVLPELTFPKASYVKSIRSLRFEKHLFKFEVAWDQHRMNTRQSDTGFQVRCSVFSAPYRKWEKQFYGLPKSFIGTPIGGLSFHRIDGFEPSEWKHQSYYLNFKNRHQIKKALISNIGLHYRDFFSAFEAFDDAAIDTLEATSHRTFPQVTPLIITDFLIMQDRIDEAWQYLGSHDDWYKDWIQRGKSGDEGLNDLWGPPYYLRVNKLKALLELK